MPGVCFAPGTIGAGAICSNLRLDQKPVVIRAPDGVHESGLKKFGAILGDLLFAFIKRRLGISPGKPLPLWDQVGFIILAVLLGSLVEPRPTWQQDVAMIVTTIPVHYVSNLFAWGLSWKKEPW